MSEERSQALACAHEKSTCSLGDRAFHRPGIQPSSTPPCSRHCQHTPGECQCAHTWTGSHSSHLSSSCEHCDLYHTCAPVQCLGLMGFPGHVAGPARPGFSLLMPVQNGLEGPLLCAVWHEASDGAPACASQPDTAQPSRPAAQ